MTTQQIEKLSSQVARRGGTRAEVDASVRRATGRKILTMDEAAACMRGWRLGGGR